MGFGLHFGWGIEGAIGSEFKIDASYLSPNVNLASRLEAATKQYGVPLLISHQLVERCSESMRKYTRKIDIVTVKGSRQPMGLFTIDVETDNLPKSKDPILYLPEERQVVLKMKKKEVKTSIEESGFDTNEYMQANKDMRLIVKPIDELFNKTWSLAFDYYISGKWDYAKLELEKIQNQLPDDGPTKTIYDVLQEHHFKAPNDWAGFRELTEK